MQHRSAPPGNLPPKRGRGLLRILESALDLRPGEHAIVSAVLVHSLFEGFAVSLVLTAAQSLFLQTQSIGNLPWVYIAGGIAAFALNWVYSKLEHRVSMARLLKLSVVLLLIPVLLFRFVLVTFDPAIGAFGLLAWYLVMFAAIDARYWELNSVLFDVRQGKRLFGLLGVGESTAKVIGFLSVPGLVHVAGVENLLVVAALSLVVALVVLHRMLERHSDRLAVIDGGHGHDIDHDHGSSPGPFARLDRYRLLLVAFAACAIGGYTLIEFGFLSEVQSRFRSLSELAPFLGVFFGVAHALDILFKALLSGRFIRRFGIGPPLVILPIALLGVAILVASSPPPFDTPRALLILFGFNMLATEVFRGSLANSAYLLLFQPLAPRRRLEAHMAKALGDPLVIAVVGFLLLVVARPGPQMLIRLSYALIVIMVLWIGVAVILKGAYVQTIRRSLRRRILGTGQVELDPETTRELIAGPLRGERPGEVLYALDLLATAEHPDMEKILRELAHHPSPEVRRDIIRRIEASRPEWGLEMVRGMLEHETDPAILGEAVRVSLVLDEQSNPEDFAELFDDPRSEVCVGALSGALLGGGLEGIITAGKRVLDREGDKDPFQRETVARVIGTVGRADFYRPLVALLRDRSPRVRHAAVVAAGRVGSPQLAPLLTSLLSNRSIREAVCNALVEIGEPAARTIVQEWASDDTPARRRLLVRLVGRIPSATTFQLLEELVDAPDRRLREEALEALHRIAWTAGDHSERVMNVVHQELDDADVNRLLRGSFANAYGSDSSAIIQALDNEMNGIRRRLLLLLSFVYDRSVMVRVRDHLHVRSTLHMANAIEILELTLDPQLARRVVPIFEEMQNDHATGPLTPLYAPEQGLRDVISDPAGGHTAWTKACAVQLCMKNPDDATLSHVQRAVHYSHPVVREAALVATTHGPGHPAPTLSARTELPNLSIPGFTPARKRMLSIIDKILTLKTVEIFSEIEDATLIDIATIVDEAHADANTTIITKGDVGSCMYIIHEGRVRVHDGAQVFTEFGDGEIFGELSLLDPEPRSASVTAITDTLLLRLDQESFYELLSDNPSVGRGVIRILCQRLRRLNQKMVAVAGRE